MTFTVNTLTRCSGQNHYTVNLTFAGGPTVNLKVDKGEMDFDPMADKDAARQEIVDRLRSAVKEANATTFAQARTALETKTFKV